MIWRTITRADAERRYPKAMQDKAWKGMTKPSFEYWWYMEETQEPNGTITEPGDPGHLTFDAWMEHRLEPAEARR